MKGLFIGLTGGLCSGKNAAAAILEGMGFAVLDVDKLGHLALARQKEAVRARFGDAVIKADGSVDRRALGAIIYSDAKAKADLEAIVHPGAIALSEEWVAERLSDNPEADLCINAALLHRMPGLDRFDAIVTVTANLLTRVIRSARRDRISPVAAWRRATSQKAFPAELKALAQGTGAKMITIHNDSNRAALGAALARAIEGIRHGRSE